KGFQGKLLEEVLDVLMADDNRLLRVMVEEELGLTLETHEHPLKQAVGALCGSLLAAFVCLASLTIDFGWGMILSSFIVAGASAGLSAHYSENRVIQAVVWNLGLWVLSFGTVYFLLEYIFPGRHVS